MVGKGKRMDKLFNMANSFSQLHNRVFPNKVLFLSHTESIFFLLQLVVSEILSNCAIFVTVTNEDWKTFYKIRQFIFLFNLSMGWSTPTMSNIVSH